MMQALQLLQLAKMHYVLSNSGEIKPVAQAFIELQFSDNKVKSVNQSISQLLPISKPLIIGGVFRIHMA